MISDVTFPAYFHVFGHSIHPHLVFELAGYSAGSQLYFYLRRRAGRTPVISGPFWTLPIEQNLWIIVGCVFGALFGSKVLAWVESWPQYWPHRHEPAGWFGGKTIVGGLLGGWAGVEIVKRALGVTRSTGDLFVFPLIVGMSLGRVGCFLTGLEDHTCGAHASLPWAVDFGDGPRHPNQLYEIAALMLIGGLLLVWPKRNRRMPAGVRFRLFLAGYLVFRFGVEFIHAPRYAPYLGLSAIQVACAVGLIVLAVQLWRMWGATGAETPAGNDRSGRGLSLPLPTDQPTRTL